MIDEASPRSRALFTGIAGVLLLAGCSLLPWGTVAEPTLTASNHGGQLGTAPPATATPFEPLEPTTSPGHGQLAGGTPTPTITVTPTPGNPWGDFPAPAQPSAIEIEPPMPALELPEGMVHIILMGSDEAPHRYGHRTDTMMILSLDRAADRAVLISIPRDLYVYIPGWKVDRINVADVFGGADMVAQAILYNFGIEVDHWAFVNFEGFTAAVDALGGITVEVGGYLHDECGGEMYTYTPGTYHMDGSTALCYVRMRKRSSDFDRLRRQQEVLRAVYRRVLSLDGLTRVPQLYGQFNRLLKTDMGLEDLVPLVPLAADLASGEAELSAYSLGPSLAVPWRVPSSGASVLLPNRKGIRELLEEAYALEDGGLETSQGWQGDP